MTLKYKTSISKCVETRSAGSRAVVSSGSKSEFRAPHTASINGYDVHGSRSVADEDNSHHRFSVPSDVTVPRSPFLTLPLLLTNIGNSSGGNKTSACRNENPLVGLNDDVVSVSLSKILKLPSDPLCSALGKIFSYAFAYNGAIFGGLGAALYVSESTFVSLHEEGDYSLPSIFDLSSPASLMLAVSLFCFALSGVSFLMARSSDVKYRLDSITTKAGNSLSELGDKIIDLLADPVEAVKELESHLDTWGENILHGISISKSSTISFLSPTKSKSKNLLDRALFDADFAGYASAELEQEEVQIPQERLIDRILHKVLTVLENTLGKLPLPVFVSMIGGFTAFIFTAHMVLPNFAEYLEADPVSKTMWYGCGILSSILAVFSSIPLFVAFSSRAKGWFDSTASKIDNQIENIRTKCDI